MPPLPHRTQKPQKTTARDRTKLALGYPKPSQTMFSPGTSPLWVGIRNSAMTPNIELRQEETSFTLLHRAQKPQKTTTPDPIKLAQGPPQPVRLWVAQVLSPLWVGIPNSAMTPNIEARLEETSFTLPYRTQNTRKLLNRTPKIGALVSPAL